MPKYALRDENGKLIAIGTGYGGTEITETEYHELLTIIREKAALVDSFYNGEITIDSVREDWREEIQRRVNERIEMDGALDEQDISAEEALDIILGGGTE